jgi:bacteriophage HK97-gp10 putative tail-component
VSSRVVFDGLDALKAELRRLPDDLVAEATDTVKTAANDAAQQIIAEYPEVTGALDKGVKVTVTNESRFGVVARLRSSAKHASWWEHGTEVRHYITVHGRKKSLGRMAPQHTVVRAATAHRKTMYRKLKEMLVRHGAEVSGDA